MTEEDTFYGYQDLEGKVDLANVLSAIIEQMGGSVKISAQTLFAMTQIDRTLVLEYNEEDNTFDAKILKLGKDEAEQANTNE